MRCPAKEIWNGDYKCINIDCNRNIPAYIVKKQFTHPTYRVCSSCKIRDSIRWKCIGCDGVINNNMKRSGSFYCSVSCVAHSRHMRTYTHKIRNINVKRIKTCIYCTKTLNHKNAMKYCGESCRNRNKTLLRHRLLLKNDVNRRSKFRFAAQHPAKSKEKSDKRLEYHRQYQLRYRNIKRLVNKINNKQTHI